MWSKVCSLNLYHLPCDKRPWRLKVQRLNDLVQGHRKWHHQDCHAGLPNSRPTFFHCIALPFAPLHMHREAPMAGSAVPQSVHSCTVASLKHSPAGVSCLGLPELLQFTFPRQEWLTSFSLHLSESFPHLVALSAYQALG